MANEGDHDPSTVIRNIIESVCTGGEFARGGQAVDNVAHLLAAIAAQVNQNVLSQQCGSVQSAQTTGEAEEPEAEGDVSAEMVLKGREGLTGSGEDFQFNPQDTGPGDIRQFYTVTADDSPSTSTVEVHSSDRPKPICVKFPTEVRKAIITMRKEGKKSKDIAKELKVSVSGVQKVWERFLATGMIHDRKPSSYAGRPRKYVYSQDGLDTQFLGDGSVEGFQCELQHYLLCVHKALYYTVAVNDGHLYCLIHLRTIGQLLFLPECKPLLQFWVDIQYVVSLTMCMSDLEHTIMPQSIT